MTESDNHGLGFTNKFQRSLFSGFLGEDYPILTVVAQPCNTIAGYSDNTPTCLFIHWECLSKLWVGFWD